MTIDEQISALDENVRRLKIEYDVYFGGGSKRPPSDTEWRVTNTIKRLSDGQKLTFVQRFKFNSIMQRYAVFSDLWRQKVKIREEGYRRPQDAILGIQGLRTIEERATSRATGHGIGSSVPFSIQCSDPDSEVDKVVLLYEAMLEAKRRSGERVLEGSEPGNIQGIRQSQDATDSQRLRLPTGRVHCRSAGRAGPVESQGEQAEIPVHSSAQSQYLR